MPPQSPLQNTQSAPTSTSPRPQGRERIRRLDGSVVDEFGNVVDSGQTISPLLENPNTDEVSFGQDAFASVMKGIGAVAPFLFPSAGVGSMTARALASAVPGTIGDVVQEKDPIDSAVGNLAMGVGGEGIGLGLSKAAPYVGLAAGLQFKDLGKRAAAFNRDATTRRFPIRPGASEKRMDRAIKVAQGELKNAEEAAPGRFAYKDVLDDAQTEYIGDIGKKQFPTSTREFLDSENYRSLVEHTLERAPIFQGMTPAQAREAFAKLSPQMQNKLLESTTLNVRELNELSRGMKVDRALLENSPQANPVAKQREINIDREIRDVTNSVDSGDIAKARGRFSDLKTMERANEELRGGLGAATIRGAAGATTLGTLARLAGMGGSGLSYGSLLALLPPKIASGSFDLLSEVSRLLPQVAQGGEAIHDITGGAKEEREKEEKRKARLRRP